MLGKHSQHMQASLSETSSRITRSDAVRTRNRPYKGWRSSASCFFGSVRPHRRMWNPKYSTGAGKPTHDATKGVVLPFATISVVRSLTYAESWFCVEDQVMSIDKH